MALQRYCGPHILGQEWQNCDTCWAEKERTLKNEQKAILSGLLIWNDILKEYRINSLPLTH